MATKVETKDKPCCYCGGESWTVTATLIGCNRCGVVYGRVNGAWVLDPETTPEAGNRFHYPPADGQKETTP